MPGLISHINVSKTSLFTSLVKMYLDSQDSYAPDNPHVWSTSRYVTVRRYVKVRLIKNDTVHNRQS